MRRADPINDDETDDVDEELETAWLAYWTSKPGTSQARTALDNYKRLSERRPLPPPRVPVYDATLPRPSTFNDPPLLYMRGLPKPWRLEIALTKDRSVIGYYETEAEARKTARRLGVDV